MSEKHKENISAAKEEKVTAQGDFLSEDGAEGAKTPASPETAEKKAQKPLKLNLSRHIIAGSLLIAAALILLL